MQNFNIFEIFYEINKLKFADNIFKLVSLENGVTTINSLRNVLINLLLKKNI